MLHPRILHVQPAHVQPERRGRSGGDAAPRLTVVVEDRFAINRVTALPMETRAIVAEWRAGARELTVHHSTQTPHLVRKQLAESCGSTKATCA